MLGVSLKQAAEQYGLSYGAAKMRASREKWPKPASLAPKPGTEKPDPLPPVALAAQSWAERGELHRDLVFKLAHKAIKSAAPKQLEDWADIERAVRIADRAAGLDKAAPIISINFPDGLSSETKPVLDVLDV